MPVSAIVERDIHTDFSGSIEQTFALGVLTHCAHGSSRWQISVYTFPALPKVGCFVSIRRPVVRLMAIDRHIRCSSAEVTGFDEADAAIVQNRSSPAVREVLWRNVRPILSCIGRDMHQSIIAARPNYACLQWRLCNREHRAVVLRAGVVLGDGTT